MMERQAVTVFVRQNVAEPTGVVGSSVVERVGGVDHHIAVVGKIVEGQNAEIAVDVASGNTDVRANPLGSRTGRKRGPVVGQLVHIRVPGEFRPAIKHLHKQVVPRPVGDVRPTGCFVVDRIQPRDQIAGGGGVGCRSVRQQSPGDRRWITLLKS